MNPLIRGTIAMFLLSQSSLYCHSPHKVENKMDQHGAVTHQIDGSRICVDRISNDRLLVSRSPESSSTYFCSLKIAFEDSSQLSYNEKQKSDWVKYFNYSMEKQWCLLDHADSLLPVFFQPLIKKTPSIDEGVLIFEVTKGHTPDTIIYKDQYSKQNQILILKN